jgi:methylglyoxal synthase
VDGAKVTGKVGQQVMSQGGFTIFVLVGGSLGGDPTTIIGGALVTGSIFFVEL